MTQPSQVHYQQIPCANVRCGKLFSPRKYWQKFCSTKCRMQNASDRRREAMGLLKDQEDLA